MARATYIIVVTSDNKLVVAKDDALPFTTAFFIDRELAERRAERLQRLIEDGEVKGDFGPGATES